MKRKQFTFYRSFYESAQKVRDPMDRLHLYEAVMGFALDGVEPVGLEDWPDSVFISIRPNLEASMAKAEQGLKGKRGPSNSSKNNKGEKEKKKKKESEKKKEKKLDEGRRKKEGKKESRKRRNTKYELKYENYQQ